MFAPSSYYDVVLCCELHAGMGGRCVDVLSVCDPMLEVLFSSSGGIRNVACIPS